MAADPYYDSLVLALPFQGDNNSTTFTDVSPYRRSVTVAGNAKLSNAQRRWATTGLTSGAFDGAGDYLDIASGAELNFGTGPMTISGWVRLSAIGAVNNTLVSKYLTWSSNLDFSLYVNTAGRLSFAAGDAAPIYLTSVATFSGGTWGHFAVTRDGAGVTRLFVDGAVQDATHTGSVSIQNDRSTIRIGANCEAVPSEFLNGHLQDLRIYNGAALWTGSFTPPGSIAGTISNAATTPVLDDANANAARLIRAWSRPDGHLRASATSDAGTGRFTLHGLYNVEHNVIAHDDTAGTQYDDRLISRVLPVLYT